AFTGCRSTSENLASTIAAAVGKRVAKAISVVASIAASVSKGAGRFPLESLVPSDVVGRVFAGARAISDSSLSVMSDSVTTALTRSEERRVGKAWAGAAWRDEGAGMVRRASSGVGEIGGRG